MNDPKALTETFVDAGPLFTLLSSVDHQILYGRRGTGKTHALKYLAETVRSKGDIAIYVDMRVLGSTGGILSDPSISLRERGTRLLVDVLAEVTDALERYTLGLESDILGDESVFPLLDRLANEVTTLKVVGTVEVETKNVEGSSDEGTFGVNVAVAPTGPSVGLAVGDKSTASRQTEKRTKETGVEQHRIHFGAVSGLLRDIGARLPSERIWILLDEWSAVPIELQPLLADFIRRAVLPVAGYTVKIGAIEQRSRFRVQGVGDYIGIEVGADMAADVDLDDFMVFGNDATRAKNFFRDLLFKHVRAVYAKEGKENEAPATADALVSAVFTQRTALDEFVRAAEGVPRDAINIVSLAVQRAGSDPISVAHVRSSARAWYQRDKENAVADKDARDLLHWIIDEVIAKRRARACLVLQGPRGTTHPLIESLFDSRVLHVVKKGVSAKDQPGVRFDAYALDFGCYVELVSTAKEPKGLFEAGTGDEAAFVQVPQDDYRSIRNAVLDLDSFERRALPLAQRELPPALR